MDTYFGQKQQFKVKNDLNDNLFFYKRASSQDINWWTGVMWIIVMFKISCLDSFRRHPFTAEFLCALWQW